MKKLNFVIPPIRYPVRLQMYVDESTKKKLSIIARKNDINMSEAVEMLFKAAIPEYFEQHPILEDEEEKLAIEAEGEMRKKCQYTQCENKIKLYKSSQMVKEKGWYFCSKKDKDAFFAVNKNKEKAFKEKTGKKYIPLCTGCSLIIDKEEKSKTETIERKIYCGECVKKGENKCGGCQITINEYTSTKRVDGKLYCSYCAKRRK